VAWSSASGITSRRRCPYTPKIPPMAAHLTAAEPATPKPTLRRDAHHAAAPRSPPNPTNLAGRSRCGWYSSIRLASRQHPLADHFAQPRSTRGRHRRPRFQSRPAAPGPCCCCFGFDLRCPLRRAASVLFYRPRGLLLAVLPSTGRVAFYWPCCFLLAVLLSTGRVAFYWPRCFLLAALPCLRALVVRRCGRVCRTCVLVCGHGCTTGGVWVGGG